VYNPDALLIADFAAQSPENTFRVGLFVLSTINQHFEYVPGILKNYEKYGIACKNYTRNTKRAIADLITEQETLYRKVQHWKTLPYPEHTALRQMVEHRGFGFVKAAFFIQLVLPHIRLGCLDRHNIAMYGLSPRAFSATPASVHGLTSKVNIYLALCEQLGGSEVLWNNWTHYMSTIRPHVFPSADHVSKLHVQCILGDN